MRLSRRGFVGLSAGALALGPRALLGSTRLRPSGGASAGQGDPAYAGFKMGMQFYSLRAFDLDAALKHVKDLGLRYGQFYHDRNGRQMQLTDDPARIASYKEKLAAAGIAILSFGVQRFTKDHAENRKSFEFAKAMGFSTIVAGPTPDALDSLNDLTKEYGMKIAIHNHGPEDKTWGKLEQIQKGIENYPNAIGVCVDTGHTIRIGEDPVAWIKALGTRVHDCHLKDASGPATFNVIGKGKLDTLGALRALKAASFAGILALEYELNEKDPIADIKACLEATREACGKL